VKNDTAILLGAREAAELCGICRSTWLTLNDTGRTPAPIRLGRRVLWRREDIEMWVSFGCPNRERFEAYLKERHNAELKP